MLREAQMTRELVLRVRLSEQERQMLDVLVARRGTTDSDVVRELIRRDCVAPIMRGWSYREGEKHPGPQGIYPEYALQFIRDVSEHVRVYALLHATLAPVSRLDWESSRLFREAPERMFLLEGSASACELVSSNLNATSGCVEVTLRATPIKSAGTK